jgi:hypothetical protein
MIEELSFAGSVAASQICEFCIQIKREQAVFLLLLNQAKKLTS